MQFSRALTVTLILTLTSTALAGIKNLAPGADTTFKARDIVTATWKESGSLPLDLNPRMNNSEGEHMNLQKRRVAADPYAVPYPLQTGPTRYAPMAKKPGSAIATTAPTPQFPPSPYTVATKYIVSGTVETTLTASDTLSVTMVENMADPAPHP
ncbi:hypothetical protein BJX76DRAFT_307873 [Aspergillus varians]